MSMKQIRQETWPINQLLVFWVMIFIVLITFKFASELIVPFLIAIAFAIVLSPLLTYLERKRIPKIFSLVLKMGSELGSQLNHLKLPEGKQGVIEEFEFGQMMRLLEQLFVTIQKIY